MKSFSKHLPDVVVCDGTSFGFRKDFLPAILCEPVIKSLPVIHGSMHNDRVFIRTVQGRRLLLQYSGYSKDQKKLTAPKPLTTSEFKSMVTIIQKDSSALAKSSVYFLKAFRTQYLHLMLNYCQSLLEILLFVDPFSIATTGNCWRS